MQLGPQALKDVSHEHSNQLIADLEMHHLHVEKQAEE
jgi:hypothetical protein